MRLDSNACRRFWVEHVRVLPRTHAHHRSMQPDAFAFEGRDTLADELPAPVLVWKRRATKSLAVEFTSLNQPLPPLGPVSIILCPRP